MQLVEAWSLLTNEEQNLINDKLESHPGESDREAFNRIFGVGTADEIRNRVILIKNFIDSANAYRRSAVWQQIKLITRVWLAQIPGLEAGGGVIILVHDRDIFLRTLKQNGYAVNAWYDLLSAHRNDSAREITETSWETGMHLVNDDSDNLTTFYIHWDKRSIAFRNRDPKYWTRITEQIDAGKSHHEHFSAVEVRERLKERGVVTA